MSATEHALVMTRVMVDSRLALQRAPAAIGLVCTCHVHRLISRTTQLLGWPSSFARSPPEPAGQGQGRNHGLKPLRSCSGTTRPPSCRLLFVLHFSSSLRPSHRLLYIVHGKSFVRQLGSTWTDTAFNRSTLSAGPRSNPRYTHSLDMLFRHVPSTPTPRIYLTQ